MRLATRGARAVQLGALLRFEPRGCSSIGRAFDWQSKGRGFESPQLHQISDTKQGKDTPHAHAVNGLMTELKLFHWNTVDVHPIITMDEAMPLAAR